MKIGIKLMVFAIIGLFIGAGITSGLAFDSINQQYEEHTDSLVSSACFTYTPYNPNTGQIITFDASCSSGDIMGCTWVYIRDDSNPIHMGSGTILDFSWSQPGEYEVTVYVTFLHSEDFYTDTIEVTCGTEPPIACYECSDDTPTVNQIVTFDASCSYDPDEADIAEYHWYYDEHGPNDPKVMRYGEYCKVITYWWSEPISCDVILSVIDIDGNVDEISHPVTVSSNSNDPPHSPYQPTGPISGNKDEPLTFSTNAIDPNNDQIKYGWDWDGDNTVDEWSIYMNSGDSDSRSHSWTEQEIYDVKVKAQDEHGAESEWSIPLSITIGTDADLQCNGDITLSALQPGALITSSFTIQNSGDSETMLNWTITSYPSWGDWTFAPEQGEELTPSDGPVTVEVFLVTPDISDASFSGEITIENSDNEDDVDSISVSLTTSKSKNVNHPIATFLENFIQDHPHLFPIMQMMFQCIIRG